MGDKQTVKVSRIIASLAIIVSAAAAIVIPGVLSPVAAETKYGGGSTQAYAADAPIANGNIVVLTGKDSNRVKVATQEDVQNMFGVTVDRNTLPLTVSSGDTENEVFVAVSGTYDVLVSDQAGSIAAGDYLTLSSVNGVAMKAGDEEVTVFGRANRAFDNESVNLGKTTLKDSAGETKSVTLGSVPVTIDIKNNPNHKSTDSNLPEMLTRVGQAIAEKEVSPVRIYLSMGIAAVSLIAAIAVLYAGVRSGVISIGRNPMSKKSIFKALMQVILTSALILIIGLFAVYLLLKL